MPLDDGNQEDRPDERPQIISLKPGDLTEEEVAAVAASDKSLLPDELNLNAPLGSTTKESEFSSGTAKSDMDPEGENGLSETDFQTAQSDTRRRQCQKSS